MASCRSAGSMPAVAFRRRLQVLTTPPKAHCILPGRSDDVVYATTVEGNDILIFHLDVESGKLVPADMPSMACHPGAGPRRLALHPSLEVLYCVTEPRGMVAPFAMSTGHCERAQT